MAFGRSLLKQYNSSMHKIFSNVLEHRKINVVLQTFSKDINTRQYGTWNLDVYRRSSLLLANTATTKRWYRGPRHTYLKSWPQVNIYEGLSKFGDPFSLRLAEKSDFGAIVEMSKDIYNGFDYMPTIFFDQYRDPNVRLFVVDLIKDNGAQEAIGMFAGIYTPLDESIYAYAWRIHRNYRNRGIGKAIKPAFYEYIKQEFDPIYYYADRSYGNFGHRWNQELIFNQAPELAAKWNCLHYISKRDSTLSKAHKHPTNNIKVYKPDTQTNWLLLGELYDFLKQNSYDGYLQHDVILVPLEIKHRNILMMLNSSNLTISRNKNGVITGAAFGYLRNKPIDNISQFDIFYYSNFENEDMVQNHVYSQLQQLRYSDVDFKSLFITLQVPYQFNCDMVNSTIIDVLEKRFQIPPPYDEPGMVLARYKFKK